MQHILDEQETHHTSIIIEHVHDSETGLLCLQIPSEYEHSEQQFENKLRMKIANLQRNYYKR